MHGREVPGLTVATREDRRSRISISDCVYQIWWGQNHITNDNRCEFTTAVPAGVALVIAQAVPPDGYLPAPNQTVTVAAGRRATLTFTNRPILRINPVEETGRAVTGACYDVYTSIGNWRASNCGGGDGRDDGRIVPRFPLTPGTYSIRLTSAPTGYFPSPFETTVTIASNQTTTVTVTAIIPRAATFVVETEDESGQAPRRDVLHDLVGRRRHRRLRAVLPRRLHRSRARTVPSHRHAGLQSPPYPPPPSQTATVAAGQTATITFTYA